MLKALDEPGLTLEQVLKRVTWEVKRSTNDRQRPWILTSLERDFFFNPTDQASADPKSDAVAPRPATTASDDTNMELEEKNREHSDDTLRDSKNGESIYKISNSADYVTMCE